MNTEIKNNKEEVPIQIYLERFAQIDPAFRAKVLDIPYEDAAFTVDMLQNRYRISWPDGEITAVYPQAPVLKSGSAKIFLLRYLIEGQSLPFGRKFYAFQELPWGLVYIKPFTGRCLQRTAWKFNGSPEKFCQAAERIGSPLPDCRADAGFRFDFIGDYHLLFYLWKGDDEFPPNAQISFSDNFAAGFTAEDSVISAELIIGAISDEMKKI